MQRKTDKLDTFYDRIIDGEVFFRLNNDTAHENKIVEIKINIPGNQFFASEQSNSFEEATDVAIQALKKQLFKI